MSEARTCARCVMDTTDPAIEFDSQGHCNHCRAYLAWWEGRPDAEARQSSLGQLVDRIRAQGRGQDYDCVIGLSGGTDSSYLALRLKEWGLRPLAVHLDNGWNSELAVSNIERLVTKLEIDLKTVVLDWEEFRGLQLSFLEASVSDAEIPTDHAIEAVMYEAAASHGVGTVVSGVNEVTERILPAAWTYGTFDWRYIASVHEASGRPPLSSYPHLGLRKRTWYAALKRIKMVSVFDLLDYRKDDASRLLEERLGWRPYGGKHHESIYTRFFQSYLLPVKFSIDKRRAHLSCLICSGEIEREQALAELEREIAPASEVAADRDYVIKKLGIDEREWERIMALPVRDHREFANSEGRIESLKGLARVGKRLGVLPAKLRL